MTAETTAGCSRAWLLPLAPRTPSCSTRLEIVGRWRRRTNLWRR
jgi:hypothetical protein